jgi:hypothetical protein
MGGNHFIFFLLSIVQQISLPDEEMQSINITHFTKNTFTFFTPILCFSMVFHKRDKATAWFADLCCCLL